MCHVSIIIPTHNRSALLQVMLDSLNKQTYPFKKFEVVVVADGCYDNTIDMLKSYRASFSLKILDQPGKGAAAARNHGVKAANGNLLIFLDDDVEPTPNFIQAHIHAHANQPEFVAIGYYPMVIKTHCSFLEKKSRLWWEDKFREIACKGHLFRYTDILSGNLSLKKTLFKHVGGFDENIPFCGREDYEFGIRLIKLNVTFKFLPEAIGYHYEKPNLDRVCLRARQEGHADIIISRRHPEMRSLYINHIKAPRNFLTRYLISLMFRSPHVSDFLANMFRYALHAMEAIKIRRSWYNLLDVITTYWWFRGAIDELGSKSELKTFCNSAFTSKDHDEFEIEIDLGKGLTTAEEQIDKIRPNSVRMMFGTQPVGYIKPLSGVERLRGVHLRPLLTKHYIWPLLRAIAMGNAMNHVSDVNQLFSNHHFSGNSMNMAKNVQSRDANAN